MKGERGIRRGGEWVGGGLEQYVLTMATGTLLYFHLLIVIAGTKKKKKTSTSRNKCLCRSNHRHRVKKIIKIKKRRRKEWLEPFLVNPIKMRMEVTG